MQRIYLYLQQSTSKIQAAISGSLTFYVCIKHIAACLIFVISSQLVLEKIMFVKQGEKFHLQHWIHAQRLWKMGAWQTDNSNKMFSPCKQNTKSTKADRRASSISQCHCCQDVARNPACCVDPQFESYRVRHTKSTLPALHWVPSSEWREMPVSFPRINSQGKKYQKY